MAETFKEVEELLEIGKGTKAQSAQGFQECGWTDGWMGGWIVVDAPSLCMCCLIISFSKWLVRINQSRIERETWRKEIEREDEDYELQDEDYKL